MYAKYSYYIGTQANMLSDIVALLTGTTDKNALTAMCNKTDTTITSTLAAGWTVHDASAGTNKVCIKSEIYDTPGEYKYLVIDMSSAGTLKTTLYQDWSAVSHTGTFAVYSSDTATQSVLSTTANGVLHIIATSNMVVIHGMTESGGINTSSNMILERERFFSETMPTTGFTTSASFAAAGAFYLPYVKYQYLQAYGVNAILTTFYSIKGVSEAENNPNAIIDGAVKSLMGEVFVYPDAKNGSLPYGSITALTDVWCLPKGSVPALFTFSHGGKTFLTLPTGTTGSNYAVRAE